MGVGEVSYTYQHTILHNNRPMFVPVLINNPVVLKYQELKATVLDNETTQQVLYTLATVLGIIVGVTVWVTNRVRQWYTNGGKMQLLSVAQRVLLFVSASTEKLYYWVCDVTLAQPTHQPKAAG